MMPLLVDGFFYETMHRESYWRQLVAESELMLQSLDFFEQNPSKEAKQDLEHAVSIMNNLCIETFTIFEPQIHAGLLAKGVLSATLNFKEVRRSSPPTATSLRKTGSPTTFSTGA